MDITVAYFHSLFHLEAVKRDFEQIRAMGANAVVYAMHEQEERRWSRDLERLLQTAQECGLKVYLSPGCFGNLFAGPALAPSWYTFRHPESQVKDRHGRSHDMTCFNSERFRSWLFKEIEYYLRTYAFAGVLIDQPRASEVTCFCSVCRALCPDITDLQHFRQRSMVNFFNELFARVKGVGKGLKTMLVLLPQDLGLVEELATIPYLDTLGCDLFWQLLGEDVAQVERWGRMLVEGAHRAGKRGQLWLQNFNLTEEDEPVLEKAFAGILHAEPDDVACYYYWRNNERPDEVWQKTTALLRRIPRRQLFWQPALAGRVAPITVKLPVPDVVNVEE